MSTGAWFESEHIKTDLNGPIASIGAVANNINGEWDRLVGEKVHAFSQQDAINVLADVADKLGIRPRQNAVSIFNNFKKEFSEPGSSGMSEQHKEIFSHQISESLKSLRPDLHKDMMKNTSVMRPIEDRNFSASQGFSVMASAASEDVISALNTPGAKILVLPSSSLTKEDYAAKAMNVPVSSLPPDSVPGNIELWKASYIVHELEHLTKQLPEKGRSAAYYDAINESDSDVSMHDLIAKYDDVGFRDYHIQTRIISAVSTSVRVGDDTFSHYTYGVLTNRDALKTDGYALSEDIQNASGLVDKLRDELGVSAGVGNLDLSLKDVAQAVQVFLDGTSKAHENAQALSENGHEVDVEVLTAEERKIAENFMSALEKTGFTQMWDAEEKVEPVAQNLDNNVSLAPQ